MGKVRKNIKLNENKHVAVTVFKSKPYFHVNDVKKNKSVSFSKEDLKALVKNGSDILEVGDKLRKTQGLHKKKEKENQEIQKRQPDGLLRFLFWIRD